MMHVGESAPARRNTIHCHVTCSHLAYTAINSSIVWEVHPPEARVLNSLQAFTCTTWRDEAQVQTPDVGSCAADADCAVLSGQGWVSPTATRLVGAVIRELERKSILYFKKG